MVSGRCRRGGSVPCPALASESPGIQATVPGCLGSSQWGGLPAPWSALPPRAAQLTLQAGVRTFSTYSTRPRRCPTSGCAGPAPHPARLQEAGGQGPYPWACHPAPLVSKGMAPVLPCPSPEWPLRSPEPKLPLQQFLAPKSSLLLT